MAEQKSSGASQAPKKDLKTVKAEQKARRKADKIEAKERKKAAKANKRGFFKQIADVFKMTRKFDPSIVWWMIGAFVAALVIGLDRLGDRIPSALDFDVYSAWPPGCDHHHE